MAPDESTVMDYSEISNCEILVTQPVVSVVMLAYNHAAYIAQAIAGVLAQKTTFPFELIIGEDASTDATREVALQFQREAPQRIRVMFSEHNVGMHANHRRLVGAARGEFIAYCEGDDYWLDSSKLEMQVEFMRKNPTCDLVHGNYVNLIEVAGMWRTRLAFSKPWQLDDRAGNIYPAMLQANRVQTCTALIKRKSIVQYRTLGPGVDSYSVGDWPEFLYVTHEAGAGFINKPLAAYRRTPGSVTNSGPVAAVHRGLDAIRMVREFCDFFSDEDETRRKAMAMQYRALLQLAFYASDEHAFDLSWKWLARYEPERLSAIRVRLMGMLIRRSRARRISLGLLFAFDAAFDWIGSSAIDKEIH